MLRSDINTPVFSPMWWYQRLKKMKLLLILKLHSGIVHSLVSFKLVMVLFNFFTVWRYACAVPYVLRSRVCLSVCVCLVSVTNRCSTKMDQRIELILAWMLASTDPTLCNNEIRMTPNLRVLFSETLSKTLDLENFARISRSSLGVVNKAHRRTLEVYWSHLRRSTRRHVPYTDRA